MNKIALKLAFRNLLKNKLQSVICIIGMGFGMGSVILISLLAIHHHSFDKNIPDHKNLFRVIHGNDCRTSFPLAELASSEIPGIDNFFRYMQTRYIELQSTNNVITRETAFGFADPSIFECLGINFIQGNPALNNNEITISEQMANKHFGNAFPIGEVMNFRINHQLIPLKITGVYRDFPANSTLSANYLAHIDLCGSFLQQDQHKFGHYRGDKYDYLSWDKYNFATYFILNNENPKYISEQLSRYNKFLTNETRKKLEYTLQPVSQIYLGSNEIIGNTYARQGNANDLYYYVGISLLIFAISLINFIALTQAGTVIRAHEMGAKKAMGAHSFLIRKQIITESFFITAISFIPAIAILFVGIPYINNTLGQNIDLSIFKRLETWFALGSLFVITGFLSGYIIGGNISKAPVTMLLKGRTSKLSNSFQMTNAILSVHFVIFILLVISVITLKKQINFALNNFEAINTENVLVYELSTPSLSSQFEVIKNEIEKIPGTIKVAGSSFIPPFNSFLPVNLLNEGERISFDGLIIGKGMLELLEIEIIDGETFGHFDENQTNVIFNESAARQYNLKAGELFNNFHIKGIVKDFNAHSLHSLIEPMAIIQQHPDRYSLMAIKTNGLNDKAIIEALNNQISVIAPEQYVNYYYLREQINRFYRNEERQSALVKSFSLVAIILAVMGLFGMVVITANRKTKEIGIRKVNGARISEILLLLNKDFIKWVAIAFVIATPIAYCAMHKWLQNFAYKTELSWWIFALAGLLAIGIALLTVSLQSWRAARMNPVKALRYE